MLFIGRAVSNTPTILFDMKHYFVNGNEISEQEAKAIEQKNKEYMKSPDLSDWAKCEFITVINA